MARDLPNSKANPLKNHADDVYNRVTARNVQDIAKDREDPQPGPVEKRARTYRRRSRNL